MKNRKLFLMWTVLLLYYVLTVTQHITVTNIIINPLNTPFGLIRISDYMQGIGIFVAGILLVFITFRFIKGHKRFLAIIYWGLWFVSVLLANRYLLFSSNEYVHYPQYAAFTFLLSLCIDRTADKMPFARLMFWSVIAGSADELAQYLYICSDWGDYFDFNDIILNTQGSVAGFLLRYGYRGKSDKGSLPAFKTMFKKLINSFEGRIAFAAVSIIFILIFADIISITPPEPIPRGSFPFITGEKTLFLERQPGIMGGWNAAPVGRYYVLSVLEGTLLTIFYVLLFWSFVLFYRPERGRLKK